MYLYFNVLLLLFVYRPLLHQKDTRHLLSLCYIPIKEKVTFYLQTFQMALIIKKTEVQLQQKNQHQETSLSMDLATPNCLTTRTVVQEQITPRTFQLLPVIVLVLQVLSLMTIVEAPARQLL